jgi:hypothetical protein
MRRRVIFPVVTVWVAIVSYGAAASVIASKTGLTLHCYVQTVEHLNCGGGLRLPNEAPPDCQNFVSEHVVETNKQMIVLPNRYVRYLRGSGQFSYRGMNFSREGEKIVFGTFPNMYTDAAGYSVDKGVCKSAIAGSAFQTARTGKK